MESIISSSLIARNCPYLRSSGLFLAHKEDPSACPLPVISFRFNIGYILGERLADMVEKSKSK